MNLPKNFVASVFLAVALAGVAVITAAVGLTTRVPPARSMGAIQPLSRISDPKKLLSAVVLDRNGRAMGEVIDVSTDAGGKVSRVKIALLGRGGERRVITVQSNSLGVDPARRALVAQLSRVEANQLAGTAPVLGGGGGGGRGTTVPSTQARN